MGKTTTPAAAPEAPVETPAPAEAAAAPAAPASVAAPAPAEAAALVSLDEACAAMSARSGAHRPAGKALLAAFNFEEERAGRLFDTEDAYRARLAAFAAAPAGA